MLASSQSTASPVPLPVRHGQTEPWTIDLNDPRLQPVYWYANRFRTQYATKEGAD